MSFHWPGWTAPVFEARFFLNFFLNSRLSFHPPAREFFVMSADSQLHGLVATDDKQVRI